MKCFVVKEHGKCKLEGKLLTEHQHCICISKFQWRKVW